MGVDNPFSKFIVVNACDRRKFASVVHNSAERMPCKVGLLLFVYFWCKKRDVIAVKELLPKGIAEFFHRTMAAIGTYH